MVTLQIPEQHTAIVTSHLVWFAVNTQYTFTANITIRIS